MKHALLIALTLFVTLPALAADKAPVKPAFLQTLETQGAQLRYLGNEHGLNGWIAIHRGQEQYFYTTEDGAVAVSGILIDEKGRNLTLKQVYELQQKNGGDTLDLFAEKTNPLTKDTPETAIEKTFKTPSEQLFMDIEESNWFPLGQPDAPVIYTFIDPQCGHCHAFLNELRQNGVLDNGTVQVRIIPVGFKTDTRAQAAFLLAVPEPQNRLYQYLDGVEEALPISAAINQQGAVRNLAIMQSWKLNATPTTIYRGKNGKVKILEGRPANLKTLLKDLPAGK